MAITQEHRRCKVTSPLGEDKLILTSLDASERISGPYQIDCRFVSEDQEIDFGKIIGQPVGLEIEMAEGQVRYFHGMVSRFSQSDADTTNIVYQAQIVPWLWFLTRRTDCRIFQGDTVVQVIEKVFAGYKRIANFKPDFEGSYDPIPYCVQYRETDFAFVSRLTEEWGIGYYFEHSKNGHKMVLFDSNAKLAPSPGQAKAAYTSATAGEKTPGQVREWRVQQEFRSGAYALTDYNYRDPGLDLGVQKTTRKAVGGNDAFELYEYPGAYQALAAGNKCAQVRIEAEECAAHAIHGAGTCYGFTAGYKFDLLGHYRDSFNGAYVITEVHHSLSEPIGTHGGSRSDYSNTFTCIPASVPYRPLRRTPKPVIQGAQTAMVVGEGGKEIDIDDLGCVYLKFHWDRNAKGDASSSCPVRVTQAWAGKEWGAAFAPRIGHEVIVEFLEGNPDRPIVTGCVYNGENKPPYASGEHMGIKSRSTPKGGASNCNEIRMEDGKGKELFYLQAERDLSVHVKSNKNESVGGSKVIEVSGDHTESVTGSMSQTALASGETIKLAKALTIGAAYQVSVGAAMNTTVIGAKMEEVAGFRLEAVGGASLERVRGRKSVSSRGPLTLSTRKSLNLSADDKGYLRTKKKLEIAAEDQLYIDAKKSIVIESDEDITLRAGKAEIVLKKKSGEIEIKCQKLKQEGKSQVKVRGGKVAIN